VPATLTVGQFQEVIKKRLRLVPEKAMHLFCSITTLPNGKCICLENSTWIISHYQLHSAAIMLDMYEDRKDEDGKTRMMK